jgi:hypothetical protein
LVEKNVGTPAIKGRTMMYFWEPQAAAVG